MDTVSFKKLQSNDLAINHSGDNEDGKLMGDDEIITIDLSKIDADARFLCFVINSYSGHSLDDISAAGCHLFDAISKREVCSIDFTREKSIEGMTACIMCILFKSGDDWWVESVEEGIPGRTVEESFVRVAQQTKNIATRFAELRLTSNAAIPVAVPVVMSASSSC
jgi:tellurium resistance protein TerZ